MGTATFLTQQLQYIFHVQIFKDRLREKKARWRLIAALGQSLFIT